jgi:hypothetical protein
MCALGVSLRFAGDGALDSQVHIRAVHRRSSRRGRSSRPPIPCSANRSRQIRTVFTRIDSARPIAVLDTPSEASSTILARYTSRTGAVQGSTTRLQLVTVFLIEYHCPAQTASSIPPEQAGKGQSRPPGEIVAALGARPGRHVDTDQPYDCHDPPSNSVNIALQHRLDTHQRARWPN